MLTVNAYGVTSATEPLAPMTTSRRDPKARTSGPSGPTVAAEGKARVRHDPRTAASDSRPRDHPVAFTQKVLLEPGPVSA